VHDLLDVVGTRWRQDLDAQPKYWFPAKRYGWGWGLPVCWQGWLVMAAYVGLVVFGAFLFPPRTELAGYLIYLTVLCAVLIGICWRKGEPPRWRWGDDRREGP
jgi:hypothetical protein